MLRKGAGIRLAALDPLGLSPREGEVLSWIAYGKTNAEIGTILRMSPRTAQKHRSTSIRNWELRIERRLRPGLLRLRRPRASWASEPTPGAAPRGLF